MEKLGDWVKRLPWLAALALLTWLGGNGADGGFFNDIWTSAKTASPLAAMICMYLLFDERSERREAQRQCNERTVDFIGSTNLQARSTDKMADAIRGATLALQTQGIIPRERKKRSSR